MKNKIVITGIAGINSLGINHSFWNNLLEGKNNFTLLNTKKLTSKNYEVGLIKNFNFNNYYIQPSNKFTKNTQIILSGIKMAMETAGLNLSSKEKCGLLLGTTFGENQIVEHFNETWHLSGPESISQQLSAMAIEELSISRICNNFTINGPVYSFNSGTLSGLLAIKKALELLDNDQIDVAIVAGININSKMPIKIFDEFGLLSNDVSKPYSNSDNGINIGEGLGILILEKLDRAKKRDANIYSEIINVYSNRVKKDPFKPDSLRTALDKTIKHIIGIADMDLEDIDLICLNASGIQFHDDIESQVIQKLFKNRFDELHFLVNKPFLGHLLAATVPTDIIASSLALLTGEKQDLSGLDIDFIDNKKDKCDPLHALSIYLSFKGDISTVLLKQWRD